MARRASADRLVGDAVEVLALKRDHLERAVAAMTLADAAERLARVEVMRARELDGATWAEVGEALGVRPQTAHERFRSGPDGLHSRFDRRQGKLGLRDVRNLVEAGGCGVTQVERGP
jgi:hypothetical protein